MDLHENCTTDVAVDNEELIKFWKSSASRSGSENFLWDFSTLRSDGAFSHNLADISGKLIGSSCKFYRSVSLDKEVPLTEISK